MGKDKDVIKKLRRVVEPLCFWFLLFSFMCSFISTVYYGHKASIDPVKGSYGITDATAIAIVFLAFAIIMILFYNVVRFCDWRENGYN